MSSEFGCHRLSPVSAMAMGSAPPDPRTQQKLFEDQVALWTGAGMATRKELQKFVEWVPDRGIFLIVPQLRKPYDFDALMRLVEVDGMIGVNRLYPHLINDIEQVPTGPYLVLDIEDGRGCLNMSALEAREKIAAEGRLPYTAVEGILHAAVFPLVLRYHAIDCVGSVYNRAHQAGDVPGVHLRFARPAFRAVYQTDLDPRRGAASCGRRVGLT